VPTNLFYREFGQGSPLLFLHGGWGYGVYPFDIQIEQMHSHFRILIPDRTGYGRSSRITSFPPAFHECAAEEMRQFLDALGIDCCHLWGHSDGAVIAARMALRQPERFPSIILEAVHYDRCKPSSRGFFETAATDPRKFGSTIVSAMEREHGVDYWEHLLKVHGQAWLDILDTCVNPERDLYSGAIGDLRVPALLLHGSEDPRTEPVEIQALQASCPILRLHLIPGAGHSPHSEPISAAESTRAALKFFNSKDRRAEL
jgi:pimeloyl-ACP methyl ester carboxylesterase